MGDVKENMKRKGVSGILSRLGKGKSAEDKAEHFVDLVDAAQSRLQALISHKDEDLADEKGQESENRKKLAILKAMNHHFDEICDLAEEYGS